MGELAHDGPVVITGGAGAIGSALARALLGRGRRVRVIDNLSTGRREQLPLEEAREALSLTEADVRVPSAYAAVFEGTSELWHFAANADVRKGTADSRMDLEHGTVATREVLEAARRHDVRLVRYASSSTVYGLAKVLPTPETYGPLEPESLYGASKLAGEGLFSAYAHSYGLIAHVFRFANIIDPTMNHGIIYDLFEKLRRDPTRLEVLGDGRQAKSYLRTEDCVAGLFVATERAHDPVNIFNVGAPDRTSAREIAERVVAAHGGGARIVYTGGDRGWAGDVPQQLLSIDKLRALGWSPSLTSTGAVERTIREVAEARHLAPDRPSARGSKRRSTGASS